MFLNVSNIVKVENLFLAIWFLKRKLQATNNHYMLTGWVRKHNKEMW